MVLRGVVPQRTLAGVGLAGREAVMSVYVPLLVVLLLLSAFFSSAETAFLSLERVQVADRLGRGVPGSRRIARLLSSPRRLLSSILLGNSVANTGAAAVGTAIATDIVSGGPGILAATLVMTVLLVVFGEVGPKTVALHHNFPVARFYALPLGVWTRATAPMVWLLDGVSRGLLRLAGERGERGSGLSLGELRTAIQLGVEEGAIEREKSAMLLGALALTTQQVRRVMTPRVQIAAVEASTPLAEVARELARLGYLRLLVHEGSPDDIVGYVHVSDVNAAQAAGRGDALVREVMREPLFESERAAVARVLEAMQESGTHLVVLIDEFGVTAGIVTLEDVLEEVVGEIRSESGPQRGEEAAVRVGGRLYVEGQRSLGSLGAELGVELSHPEAETLGGLVLASLRHMPTFGEAVEVAGYRFTVLSADERRVRLVAVEAAEDGSQETGDTSEGSPSGGAARPWAEPGRSPKAGM